MGETRAASLGRDLNLPSAMRPTLPLAELLKLSGVSLFCGSGVWRKGAGNLLWKGFCAGSSQYLSSSTGWLSPLIAASVPQREG